jgi:hypothetical protein
LEGKTTATAVIKLVTGYARNGLLAYIGYNCEFSEVDFDYASAMAGANTATSTIVAMIWADLRGLPPRKFGSE